MPSNFSNLPIYLLSGIWLRGIAIIFACPVLILAALVWDNALGQTSANAIRVVGVSLPFLSTESNTNYRSKPPVSMLFNSWLLWNYLTIKRRSETPIRISRVFVFFADIIFFVILIYGFASPFTTAMSRYDESEQTQKACLSHQPSYWENTATGFMAVSPLLWYAKLSVFQYLADCFRIIQLIAFGLCL
jgi:hypothetical protein